MGQPTLHYVISSSPVIAGFINDGFGFELPMASLDDDKADDLLIQRLYNLSLIMTN